MELKDYLTKVQTVYGGGSGSVRVPFLKSIVKSLALTVKVKLVSVLEGLPIVVLKAV